MDKRMIFRALFLSLAASFLLFGNTISGDFVHDDESFRNRPELREASSLLRVWSEPLYPDNIQAGLYRPLTTFSFALNFLLFGESPVSFHIVNITLHGLAVFCLFVVTMLIFDSMPLAIAAAGLFAVMPIHTEAVANIKGRDEILGALTFLLAWICYIKSGKNEGNRSKVYIALSVFMLYLSILSKETMIVAGLAFPVAGWIRGGELRKSFKSSLYIFACIAVALLTRYFILGEHAFGKDDLIAVSNPLRYGNFWLRLWAPFLVFFYYIANAFTAFNLSISYHLNHLIFVTNPLQSWQTIAGVIIFLLSVAAIFSSRIRGSAVGVGIVVFYILYFVISRVLFVAGGDVMAERWLYAPSIGLCIAAAGLFAKMYLKYKRASIILAVCLFLALGAVTVQRNRVWLNADSLIKSVIKDAPESSFGYIFASFNALAAGDYNNAEYFSTKGLSIISNGPVFLSVLAETRLHDGKTEAAERLALRALAANSEYAPAYVVLGKARYMRKDYKKALVTFEKFAKLPGAVWTTSTGLLYAELLTRNGQYGKSAAILAGNYETGKKSLASRFLQAANYLKLGQIQSANFYMQAVPGNRGQQLNAINLFINGGPIPVSYQ